MPPAVLLHVIGPAALKAYNKFTWASSDGKQKVEMILEGHCIPCANITWERHVLNTCSQHDDETIDHYVTDLKRKVQTCKFQDLKDSLICDRIVCSNQCDKTCSRLLKEPDFILQNAINIC